MVIFYQRRSNCIVQPTEAAMRRHARKFGEEENRWAIASLLHHFDWEVCPTPEGHPTYGSQILRRHDYPEDIIWAMALVRPSKSLDDVAPASVRRKMNDKGFAKDVNREDIILGAEELGIDLDDHIAFVVESLKPVAERIDLRAG